MTAHATELSWALGNLVAIVILAALVNRFRPAGRSRLRRATTLFVLYALTIAAGFAFEAAAMTTWSVPVFVAAEVLRAFTLVSVAAVFVFLVALPALGVELPMIASDLVVGLGYVATALVVMSWHGLDLTGALVSGAAVSAVLAISLQSTLGNVVGGIALQLDGSIHEGNWIQLENGKQGRVHAVRWRHTIIETRDWSTIIVPNSQLLANNITILGRRDGVAAPQRMWVWFNIDFRFAPSHVVRVVTEALHASPIENVVAEPKPNVVCMDFTRDMRESFATYAVRYWIEDLAADDPTSSRVRARIYAALDRAEIPFALPAQTSFVEVRDEQRANQHRDRDIERRFTALKVNPLFRSLTDDELRTLARGMSHVFYTAGETITRQHAVAHWLYVMGSGTARIQTTLERDPPVVIAHVEAPGFIGEMGLMTGEPRSADVVAVTDVDCFRLGKATLEQVLTARPEIANELSRTLASRKVELMAAREQLDATARSAHERSEHERILGSIRAFFGL
jgi:small-conductance mechanosensitive channel/CRP-like cAMP-binding protein